MIVRRDRAAIRGGAGLLFAVACIVGPAVAHAAPAPDEDTTQQGGAECEEASPSLTVTASEVEVGETVGIKASCFSPRAKVEGHVIMPSGERFDLSLRELGSDGSGSWTFPTVEVGDHGVVLNSEDDSEQATGGFDVIESSEDGSGEDDGSGDGQDDGNGNRDNPGGGDDEGDDGDTDNGDGAGGEGTEGGDGGTDGGQTGDGGNPGGDGTEGGDDDTDDGQTGDAGSGEGEDDGAEGGDNGSGSADDVDTGSNDNDESAGQQPDGGGTGDGGSTGQQPDDGNDNESQPGANGPPAPSEDEDDSDRSGLTADAGPTASEQKPSSPAPASPAPATNDFPAAAPKYTAEQREAASLAVLMTSLFAHGVSNGQVGISPAEAGTPNADDTDGDGAGDGSSTGSGSSGNGDASDGGEASDGGGEELAETGAEVTGPAALAALALAGGAGLLWYHRRRNS